MNLKELNLPEFAFLDGGHEQQLAERTVILHVRSASVIEIFDREDVLIKPGVLTYKFKYTNFLGIEEPMIAALHYCATLDVTTDYEIIKKEIMKPAAKWYCDYAEWEDMNINSEGGEDE